MAAPRVTATHPLDPLDAGEIAAAVEVLREQRTLGPRTRFVTVSPVEPAKEELAGGVSALDRRAEVVLFDRDASATYEAVVSLTEGAVVDWRHVEGVQPAILVEEYLEVERLVRADPRFKEALRRRGIPDDDNVVLDPVPIGGAKLDERGHRLARALPFVRPTEGGNQYARPIENVRGLVDLDDGVVLEVEDGEIVPLPEGTGEFRAAHLGELRDDIRPINITQPEGPSFEVDGHEVRWQRWRLRVGFTPREGLVLHTVGFEDQGRVRRVLHRASYSEMAVPYGHPQRHFLSPFDIGENLIGTLADRLELGCDCLGEIHYFDAAVVDFEGNAITIPNAICMHEEDTGILWKHTDYRTGHSEVRRGRRLVISFVSTIGNYVYGFFWYLNQDGSIESEVKLTGLMNTVAMPPGEPATHGTLVAPGLNAPIHQHFFNARLDLDVDGPNNTVYEVETVPEDDDELNVHGNLFRTEARPFRRESEASSVVNAATGRTWLVTNPSRRNHVGDPVAYRLVPGENVAPFARPDAPWSTRAGFAARHVWVTAFDPRERYAAGEYPNQNPGPDGLPAWTRADRPLEDTDVVLWYTLGAHHVPRTEDWPIMPVTKVGFALRPHGFFDRNPTLDVPPPAPGDGCSHRHGAAS